MGAQAVAAGRLRPVPGGLQQVILGAGGAGGGQKGLEQMVLDGGEL